MALWCEQVVCKNISEGNYALKEAKVLQKFSHASIVKYEDMFLHEAKDEANETKLVVCIVMELCQVTKRRCTTPALCYARP